MVDKMEPKSWKELNLYQKHVLLYLEDIAARTDDTAHATGCMWSSFAMILNKLNDIDSHLANLDTLADRRKRDRERKRRNSAEISAEKESEREDGNGKENLPPAPPIREKGKGEGKEKEKYPPSLPRVCVRDVCVREEVLDGWFDEFWSAYPGPRKTDKRKCKTRFKNIIGKSKVPEKQEAAFKAIMDGIEKWKASADWQDDDGAFICAPLVWLNNERWEAEVKPASHHASAKSAPVRRPENWIEVSKEQLDHALG